MHNALAFVFVWRESCVGVGAGAGAGGMLRGG